jgi:hypothetical protein
LCLVLFVAHVLADACFAFYAEPRSAWALELDLRPYKESL